MTGQNPIDVDLLIEKLLAIPADVDVTDRVVLDSILAVEDGSQILRSAERDHRPEVRNPNGPHVSGSNTSGSVSPYGLGAFTIKANG